MKLEVPQSLVLADGSTAVVRGVAANVIDGKLDQIVFTVEKASGAWAEVPLEDVQPATARPDGQPGDASGERLEVQQVA